MTTGFTPEGYTLTMTYDGENRLTSAQYTDSGSIIHRTEYFYNGDSMLAQVKKFEDGVLASDTRFVRAGFLPVQERDGSNQVTREYTWGLDMGGGIGGLLNFKQGVADYSYLYDGKGDVSALIDNSQNVVATYTYDPFGVLMKKTGTINQSYMFSTKEYDPDTGLSYYGYRFYNPSIGKWITRDPIEEAGGLNLYGFVYNNPVNWVDLLGLYGTTDCSYYQQACQTNGGFYECYIAESACNFFPKDQETSDCIRQCLQEKHKKRQPQQQGQCTPEGQTGVVENVQEHMDCIGGCFSNPENPYNPKGPNLPSRDIRLY